MAWLKISMHKWGHCWSVLLVAWQFFVKAYWVGKVFAFFSNYSIDVWYHLKVVVSEFTVGTTYTVMGKNYLKPISKRLFFVFQFKNPVHVCPLRCNKHLEQRKCKHNLSLFGYFLGEKVCFRWRMPLLPLLGSACIHTRAHPSGCDHTTAHTGGHFAGQHRALCLTSLPQPHEYS